MISDPGFRLFIFLFVAILVVALLCGFQDLIFSDEMCPTQTRPSHGSRKKREIESGHGKTSQTASNSTSFAHDRGEAVSSTGGLGDFYLVATVVLAEAVRVDVVELEVEDAQMTK
jgi:hypothetical protein